MACKDCEKTKDFDKALVIGICRVCELVDGNREYKRTNYCNPCSAYICESCRGNVVRRAEAFSMDMAHRAIEKAKEVAAMVKGAYSKRKTNPFPTDEFGANDVVIVNKTDA